MDWLSRLATIPDHELTLTELVLPQQANHYGTLFGPNALALLGKAAYLAAAGATQQAVVMASARQVDFLAPVPVGALLHLKARITRVGHTSLTVEVRAALDAAPGTHATQVLHGSFEMVTVDELGRPTPLRTSPQAEAVL